MFIYELVTLHQPFESHESVKECILEGGRPNLTQRVSTDIVLYLCLTFSCC